MECGVYAPDSLLLAGTNCHEPKQGSARKHSRHFALQQKLFSSHHSAGEHYLQAALTMRSPICVTVMNELLAPITDEIFVNEILRVDKIIIIILFASSIKCK